VMPFYPFQKSIVKIMLKWPIENPKVVALAASLANMNAQAAADAAGAPKGTKLPQGYEDLFTSPIGTLNLHSLDPFAKVEQLVTPQGIVQALNPFLNIAIKNAYGVPNSDHLKRMDPYGHIVDDTSPASDITKLFAGAPQAKLVEGALGLSTPGQAPQTGGAQQAVSKFAGVPIFTAADVQKIVDRMAKSTATLAGTSSSSSGGGGTSGGSKSSASRSSSRYGSGTTKGHKSRIKHVRAPKGVGTGGRRKGVRINTSKVLGAASRHHASTARKVVQRGTSTAGVKFNPSRRSR